MTGTWSNPKTVEFKFNGKGTVFIEFPDGTERNTSPASCVQFVIRKGNKNIIRIYTMHSEYEFTNVSDRVFNMARESAYNERVGKIITIFKYEKLEEQVKAEVTKVLGYFVDDKKVISKFIEEVIQKVFKKHNDSWQPEDVTEVCQETIKEALSKKWAS